MEWNGRTEEDQVIRVDRGKDEGDGKKSSVTGESETGQV